ncbi:hypothetical protein [Paracraurococcus lichenis]|uniref:DNA-binding protein n=1 Tax=Paracraurococcus lichenis TaxID=3064888 RepID=A0ABT9E4U7_9PROT|nr:hypothetical protein [Paracraurococcus sp. LOR1-02]MDO9711183.1 hypothetical protein [Paracraurococcus sp. LOR1-02]
MTEPEEELPPEAAAALLGLSRLALQRLLDRGLLPGLGRAALLAWRDRQAAVRRDALAALARLSAAHDL